ncbi:hypothetical protein ACSRUE_24920 [Sorangium sp. KYC3313]|uniref:hypothetical protein n=1 Tax=Sorangium sp. KYC3313 TaxID=3449740 RepID=UPI003F8CCCA7
MERLGLSAEAGRLRRWTELYGEKLGVPEVKSADPAIKAVEAWHEAYGTLLVHVHAEYDDDRDETHAPGLPPTASFWYVGPSPGALAPERPFRPRLGQGDPHPC